MSLLVELIVIKLAFPKLTFYRKFYLTKNCILKARVLAVDIYQAKRLSCKNVINEITA